MCACWIQPNATFAVHKSKRLSHVIACISHVLWIGWKCVCNSMQCNANDMQLLSLSMSINRIRSLLSNGTDIYSNSNVLSHAFFHSFVLNSQYFYLFFAPFLSLNLLCEQFCAVALFFHTNSAAAFSIRQFVFYHRLCRTDSYYVIIIILSYDCAAKKIAYNSAH